LETYHIILEYWRQVVSKNKKHVTLIRFAIYYVDSLNLQLLINEEKTILRNSTLFTLSGNIETTDGTHIGANFLLCPSCLWSASCLSPDSAFTKCPFCIEGNIESLPIAKNEEY
jgi:hypothetical protein